MSIQNALKTIKKIREDKNYGLKTFNLQQLVGQYREECLPFTDDDFKKALELDWKMRWVKQTK